MRLGWSRGPLILFGLLLLLNAGAGSPAPQADTKSIEDAVLAVNAEMARAGEARDAERLFDYMLETDKGSVIQNGLLLATRQEALDRVRANLQGVRGIQYRWKRQYVTVLSPDTALLVAEGVSTVTTAAGDVFDAPFAQTVVLVRKEGGFKVIHAHQSSPR